MGVLATYRLQLPSAGSRLSAGDGAKPKNKKASPRFKLVSLSLVSEGPEGRQRPQRGQRVTTLAPPHASLRFSFMLSHPDPWRAP
jgi:hypothetical protein